MPVKPAPASPEPPATPTLTITLAADGRVLFHQLTPGTLGLARLLNPADTELAARADAFRTVNGKGPTIDGAA